MEIDRSNDTQSGIEEGEVEDSREGQMLYSGAVKKSLLQTQERKFKETDMQWAEHVIEKMVRDLKDPFVEKEWHYRQILEALKNEELLYRLIIYKLCTTPTVHEMPKAIQLKFKHQDRNFFRTFTRNTKIIPAHQLEIEAMINKAIQNYKGKHSITVTNKEIRDQINNKVRQKLAIQHITNSRFKKNSQEITKVINYCIGFMKLSDGLQGDALWKTANKAIQDTLLPLPEKPENILENVRELLLFEIPIKNKDNLRAILAALRKVYTLAQLSDKYFTKLELLPENSWKVCEEVKGLFSIIERKDLRKVYGYIQQQAEFYKQKEDLPESYFRLLEKKKPLLLMPQELDRKYKEMFPIDLARFNKSIKEISDILRKTYFFKFIPNDFLIQKPRLPRDVKKIITQSKYSFLIEDKEEAVAFIKEISARYNSTILYQVI
ncbi:hypothetical protein C2G38_2032637 [Gigaspora rosea]|uniref:Uncharacterized protein n=1 Tax=Gigaspora rosea TaxID=44941 RepID=A0A397VX40_9GLOM|nr:hypothetical protein C2G38_2032637 [Gigaspora rosea]